MIDTERVAFNELYKGKGGKLITVSTLAVVDVRRDEKRLDKYYETHILDDGDGSGREWRWPTREDAVVGHERIVGELKSGVPCAEVRGAA